MRQHTATGPALALGCLVNMTHVFPSSSLGKRPEQIGLFPGPTSPPSITTTTSSSSPMGLHVRLPTSCPRCGVIIAFIGAGRGSHYASLRCVSCSAFRGWVAYATYDFIIKIINKFGRPIAPITIRRGERIINSGSRQPECTPAASPAPEMSQNGKD